LAVTEANGSLLCGFAGKLFTFKTEFNAFSECAVADLAKLVFPRNAANTAVWALSALHSGTFLAGNTANTNLHIQSSLLQKKNYSPLI
jgi:hypothetical protein